MKVGKETSVMLGLDGYHVIYATNCIPLIVVDIHNNVEFAMKLYEEFRKREAEEHEKSKLQ